VLGIGLVICVLLVVIVGIWKDDFYFHDFYFRLSGDAPAVMQAEMQLCEKYKVLKNAGDSSADQLLAALPAMPAEPISQEEAERFQADCFLHQDIRILSVHLASSNQFVLVTKGNVSAPTLQIRTAKGVDRVQRTMVNPDLIVEVRDGKIHGIRAKMHGDQ